MTAPNRYSWKRVCADCPSPITNHNQSGKCRGCLNVWRSPEFERKRVEGIRRKHETDPEFVAALRKRMSRVGQKAGLDPVLTAARRERGKWLYANRLNTPEVRAKIKATRPEVGRKLREQKLAWCPLELREKYRALYRNKRIPAPQAKEIILAEWDDIRAARHPCFESVLHFIRRDVPVLKLDNGKYRVGNTELSSGEVLRRAEKRGFVLSYQVAA